MKPIKIKRAMRSNGEITADTYNLLNSFNGGIVNISYSYNPLGQVLPLSHDQLFNAYDNTLQDDQVASVFQQRRLALTSTRFHVVEGGQDRQSKKAAEALQDNLDQLPFYSIVDHMCYGLFYGYSVAEMIWRNNNGLIWIDDIKVRRARRFGFDTEGQLILRQVFNQPLTQMPDKKFWTFKHGGISSDDLYGRGLAYYLNGPVTLKKNGMEAWAALLGKYGIPTAVGEIPKGATEDTRRKLLDVVGAIHSSSGLVVPEGIKINLLEASRGGTVSFEQFVSIINNSISKIILSQTMTTDSGSSLSQAKVHMEVRAEVVKADSALISSSFNKSVVQWWTSWNYPTAIPPRLEFVTDAEEDLTQRATRDQMISNSMGWRLSLESVNEIYGEGWEANDKNLNQQPVLTSITADAPAMQQSDTNNATTDTTGKGADKPAVGG